MTGCGQSAGAGASGAEQVIIYSNADDEAVEAMKATLDANGYGPCYSLCRYGIMYNADALEQLGLEPPRPTRTCLTTSTPAWWPCPT